MVCYKGWDENVEEKSDNWENWEYVRIEIYKGVYG